MKKIFLSTVVLAILIFTGCSLAPNSTTQNQIKTFTLSASVWKSTDGGKTWEVKNKGEGTANATAVDVLSFAINPYDSQNVYVGLRKGGILETTNGGDTWRFINNFQSEKVYGLVLSPDDGRTLYASGVWQGKGKMFKTTDQGETWKEIYTSPQKGPLIISLAIDKKNPQVLYATTSEKEALKSTDGGESWKNIHLADDPILKIAIDVQDSKLLYSITNSGIVYRSKDAGEIFEKINEKIDKNFFGFGSNHFSVLRADPSIGGKVYLAGSGGIVTSQDGGENWKKVLSLNNPESFPIATLAVSFKNPQEIVYGSLEAAYASLDGGTNWTTFQFDNKMKTNVLEFDPNSADVLYLGFSE